MKPLYNDDEIVNVLVEFFDDEFADATMQCPAVIQSCTDDEVYLIKRISDGMVISCCSDFFQRILWNDAITG